MAVKNSRSVHLICVLNYLTWFIGVIHAHGYLKYPPSRGSLRDFGYENEPVNYDVHEQNCGGKDHQWKKNNGKCGLCGDPYDAFPRQHEQPFGKFATGTIVESYKQGGQLQVEVVMTWGHRGWMEFRLCPVNSKNVAVTENCLDRYPLQISGTGMTRMSVEAFGKRDSIKLTLDLPADLICSQCVLQWKYRTGKDWGCEDGAGCGLGLGPQEEFYGCADIAVRSASPGQGTTTSPSVKTTTTTTSARTVTTTPTKTTTTTRKPTTTSRVRTTTRRPTTTSQIRTTRSKTDAELWACRYTRKSLNSRRNHSRYLDNWCRGNCLRQYCPKSLCNVACQRLKPYPKFSGL